MSVVARLSAWRELSRPARTATVLAAMALPAIEAGLRLAGFGRTAAWLRTTVPVTPAEKVDLRVLRAAVDRAGRWGLVSGRCLSRSLTLWWLMARTGSAGRLKLGVAGGGREFDAHAWIENDHGIVNDSADVNDRYPVSFVALS